MLREKILHEGPMIVSPHASWCHPFGDHLGGAGSQGPRASEHNNPFKVNRETFPLPVCGIGLGSTGQEMIHSCRPMKTCGPKNQTSFLNHLSLLLAIPPSFLWPSWTPLSSNFLYSPPHFSGTPRVSLGRVQGHET